jgi:hypothetical protein
MKLNSDIRAGEGRPDASGGDLLSFKVKRGIGARLKTAALMAFASLIGVSLAHAAPANQPPIAMRIFTGYLTHTCQDTGVGGTLIAQNPSCTFTLQPSCFGNPPPPAEGGFPMTGSGSCPGNFQLLLFPFSTVNPENNDNSEPGAYPGFDFSAGAGVSDWGDAGRFNIDDVTPSKLNPNGVTVETTGIYTILQGFSGPGGGNSAPTAIMLFGMTTTRPIN